MTFTPTPPTKPGAYWYQDPDGETELVEVFSVETENPLLYIKDNDGDRVAVMDLQDYLWSPRLVPVDEVEKAFREAYKITGDSSEKDEYADWNTSHAKQVVEGETTT